MFWRNEDAERCCRRQCCATTLSCVLFFESVGIGKSITEAAIKVRRNRPAIEQDNELPARDKPRS